MRRQATALLDALRPDWPAALPLPILRSHPRAKYVRLKVLPSGQVELSLPPRCDPAMLPAFVAQHRDWLMQAVGKAQAAHARRVAERVPPREVAFAALDECWQVDYCRAARDGWWERAGRGLLLRHHGEDNWDEVLRRWAMQRARLALAPWLATVAEETELAYRAMSVRAQKTRWGSCSASGTIQLNYRLLFLPPPVVRYLMIHELCHTVHMNHSSRFWNLVARKEPRWRELDVGLRGAAARHVPPWAL